MTEETLRRPTPPDLEFRCPDCPMCDKETESDGDGFRCDTCQAWWNSDGTKGEWFDDEPGCPSVIEWYNTERLEPKNEVIRHEKEWCILPEDHGGKHRGFDSYYAWDDGDPRIVREEVIVKRP